MDAPFASDLLGWREPSGKKRKHHLVPNCADSGSEVSIQLAEGMLEALGLRRDTAPEPPPYPGTVLEERVRDDLAEVLPGANPNRSWSIERKRLITHFAQYEHLKRVDELIKASPELQLTVARDYTIWPDITVGDLIPEAPDAPPFLHAAVSCKWTIDPDHVPSVHEDFHQMIRNRSGRQPHLVLVTAEPLPSRLAAIASGTGEIDAVYHIAYSGLDQSVAKYAAPGEKRIWEECVQQRRVLGYGELAMTLARW